MNTLSSISRSGLAAAQQRMDTAASTVAAATSGGDIDTQALTQGLVDQGVAVYLFKANLQMLKTEGSLVGTLLHAVA